MVKHVLNFFIKSFREIELHFSLLTTDGRCAGKLEGSLGVCEPV